MKKIILITCITFFSCKKAENTPSGTDASGSIQYKVNGNLVVMDNVDIMTGQYVIFQKLLKGTVPNTRYQLNAQKGANNVFLMSIVTDSLSLMNYHNDSTIVAANGAIFASNYNGQTSGLIFKGDYLDVNISEYKNARISGTFTAKFTPFSQYTFGQPGSTTITEGKIKGVQVIY